MEVKSTPRVISTMKALQEEKKLSRLSIVSLTSTNSFEITIDDVSIVRNYPDVYPENLLGFAPDRKVEFTIDSKPGATPVFKAPYRMTPKELQGAIARTSG